MPESVSPDRLLRTALCANAAFSGLCGITAIAAADALSTSLGIREAIILPVQGVNLIFFAGVLLWLGTRKTLKPAFALTVVAMDLLWVAVTAVPLLLSGWLTATGTQLMIVLAGIVLSFAALQYLGVRKLKGALA